MTSDEPKTNGNPFRNVNATRVVASSFAPLAGLTGLIAGCYEMRQGNVAPDGPWISYIGPGYANWQDFTYEAFTVMPTFFLAGLLTTLISMALLAWAAARIHRRRGATVTLALTAALFLSGGARVYDIGALAALMATRIGKPHGWMRARTSPGTRRTLALLWPWATAAYALISAAMLALTVLGVNDPAPLRAMTPLAGALFIPIALMVAGALAHDIQRQDARDKGTG